MIKRLRPAWSDEELAKIYDHRYDHERWEDHVTRVKQTIIFGILKWFKLIIK